MHSFSRRRFLQGSVLLMASAMGAPPFAFKNKKPLLSFSTLGCPDWSFKQITEFARKHHYDGLELRGLLRQMDLLQCPEFNSQKNRQTTLRIMNDNGLKFVNLGSSATLHFPTGAEREKNLDEGKRYIDLAYDIQCPYVRVFPNNFPKDQPKNKTIELIAGGLQVLGEHAKEKNVKVLMETHGDAVWTEDLEMIMQTTAHLYVGLVWDFCNMWTVTKESPARMYGKLKNYIHHTHIKDAKLVNGKPQYVLLGEGDVPIFEAIDLLKKNGYKGYYSFEWEKMWHPEIDEPEKALSHFPATIKNHFNQ